MVRVRTGVFAVLGLLFVMASIAVAQQVFGSIYGTITDASGAAVNNAKITITDTSKGTVFVVNTDASGNYNKSQLVPDPYKVTIEAPGFQRVASDVINVEVDAAARYDVGLKVGDVTTEVEVSAAAPLLQSDRADVSETFNEKQIENLPVISRNVQSMTLLEPGTAKLGWQHASDENPQNSIQMVVNGLLFSQMGYELDGTTNQDPILGIIVINPNIESLSEIKQATQNYSAEYSYVAGGTNTYSTKSGTNEFHGAAFENLQINTPGFVTFAANPFTGLAAPVYRQNQFGGAIGGPIKRNKLFFFGDAQLNRQSQGGSIVTSTPDALNRTGNFSDWLAYNSSYQIFQPNTGNAATGVGRIPFMNNTIPSSQISPQAAAIMAYFLPANYQQIGGAPFENNFAEDGNVAITGNNWDTREDYYLNDKNTIFGRYSYAAFTEQAPGAFGALAGGPDFVNYAGDSQALNQSLAIGWTDTISSTLINEFRFGWERYHVFDVPNGYGTTPATTAGIPGLNINNTYASGMPYFDITTPNDPMQLGYALGTNQCNCPLTETEHQFEFVDNLSKTIGKHTIKVGADIRFAENLRVPSDSHRAGELTFNASNTGDVSSVGAGTGATGVGLATFLLGEVSGFDRYYSSSTNASEHQPRLYFYGTDEWRPTPKLTLNIGIRWEIVQPESTAPGNGATFDLANGLMYVFGEGGVSNHGIQTANYHDFAPRFGAAYQLDSKTVIRAGFGWGYDLGVFGSTFGHNVSQNPPVLEYQNYPVPNSFQDVFTLAQGPALPPAVAVSSNGTFPLPAGVSPKFRPATATYPQVYLFNATIQRQLTGHIAVSAGYVGNMSRHGFLGVSGNTTNPNEPIFIPGQPVGPSNYPYYNLGTVGETGLQYYCDCANADYNSFQATIKINAYRGLTLQGSYTYEQQYGDGASPWDSNYYYVNGPRSGGYGTDNVLPHNEWIFSEVWDVPFGRGRAYGSDINRGLDMALGGWTLSGITTYYSGFPFSPSLENYGANTQPNTGPNNRPDVGSGALYPSTQNRAQWFLGCPDRECTTGPYVYPSSNVFGNYPINTLIGPRFIQQDLSLGKTFKVTEHVGFTLRTDARNVFNHTNLGGPNTDVQSPNVGQITGLAGGAYMRSLQFSGTIRF
jgi:hypothetical protein